MPPHHYPSFADYQSALQHPDKAFTINFLKQGSVESDLWGFPRVRSGGFTLTYKVFYKEHAWAARCFHRVVRDRAIRYTQICRAIEASKLPYFVPTQYFPHGVTVKGKQFPISILEWVEGESLESFLIHNLENGDLIHALAEKFREMCQSLEAQGMAHGDLSHRNIIIKSGEIYLIDYDGMYVPSLDGRKSSELGNIHFQHPLRTNTLFNSHIDRFSSIVIYLSLQALASDPTLWKKYQSGGEGLIFQRSDFLNPERSELLYDLEKNPQIGKFIPRFREICQLPVESVPSLRDLLSNNSQSITAQITFRSPTIENRSDILVLDSDSRNEICSKEGEIITVVGMVTEVFHGYTVRGEEHIFINFGDWQDNSFTGVLWGPVLSDIQNMDISVDSWAGEWMSFSGLVSVRNQRPQIQIENLTDCVLLENEEKAKALILPSNSAAARKRASQRLSGNITEMHTHYSNKSTSSRNANPPSIKNLNDLFQKDSVSGKEEVLNQLYSAKRFRKSKKK